MAKKKGPSTRDLIRKREKLLARLGGCTDFVRGSINSVCAKCNRAGCICEMRTSRRAYRLTYKDSGQKTRIVYVPRVKLPEIRRKIGNYSKLRKIIEELVETNIEMFKRKADP
jgi:hypothetical protein